MRIGIDLGGHKIAAGRVADGRVLEILREPTPQSRDPEATTKALERVVLALGGDEAKSVGVGLPGILSRDRRSVVGLTNLPLWENYPLASILENRLSLPVALENDGNCAALGEMIAGEGRGLRDFVMITLGTGIGGAIVSDGRLLLGSRGMAGELGHIVLLHEEPCNCGGIGHGETLFSADLFDRRCSEFGMDSVTSLWIARRDPVHSGFWARSLEALSCVLVSAIHALDPQAVILSGGLSGLSDLVPELEPLINERLSRAFKPAPPLLVSSLKGEGPIIGAAYLDRFP